MLVKIIRSYRDIVVICDSDLIGKKFDEKEFQLDIKEDFFKGEETSEEKAIDIMQDMVKEDAIFNIVGEESTKTALKAGIILQEGIKKIQGIPFAFLLI